MPTKFKVEESDDRVDRDDSVDDHDFLKDDIGLRQSPDALLAFELKID